MKITIEADSKEIADLVLAAQGQPKKEESFSPKELLSDSIKAVLHEKSHDTSDSQKGA